MSQMVYGGGRRTGRPRRKADKVDVWVSCLVALAALINSSATEGGWIAKVKVSDPKELDALMDQAEYDKFCAEAH